MEFHVIFEFGEYENRFYSFKMIKRQNVVSKSISFELDDQN